MSASILERVFWSSLAFSLLRVLGLSKRRAYRALIRAEPLWLKDPDTNSEIRVGAYSTAIVMARTMDEAAALAGKKARRALLLSLGSDPRNALATLDIEETVALSGVAWRSPRGFSLYPLD